MRCWLFTPKAANSPLVRAASVKTSNVSTGDEHERGQGWVAQRLYRLSIELLLRLQACQRPQARCPRCVVSEKTAPRRRQGQKPQGMSRRRGIEDHMIKHFCGLSVPEQLGELVKGSDFHGARAR